MVSNMREFKMTDNERFSYLLAKFDVQKESPDKFMRYYYKTQEDYCKTSAMKAYICRNFEKIIKLLKLHFDLSV